MQKVIARQRQNSRGNPRSKEIYLLSEIATAYESDASK